MSDEDESFKNLKPYLFYREEGVYTVDLRNDKDAIDCTQVNEGTLEVARVNEDESLTTIYVKFMFNM